MARWWPTASSQAAFSVAWEALSPGSGPAKLANLTASVDVAAWQVRLVVEH